MTELEAIAIAVQYTNEHALTHAGVSHAHFFPTTDPFYARDGNSDLWFVYFFIQKTEGWDRFDTDCFLIEVDCTTRQAQLIPSL